MSTEPLTGEPNEQQIQQQLAKLRKHLQGGKRFAALQWLIEFQRRGQFEPKLHVSAKEIYQQFYDYSVEKKLSDEILNEDVDEKLEAIAARVKKLFGDLDEALQDYYSDKGANEPVHIELQRGQGGRFEPLIELNRTTTIPKPLTVENANNDNGVISDTDFISGIEAKVAHGTTDIWVAAPNLSNVGDESAFSELVRRTVCENARRGVDYTYICPEDVPGDSRKDNLASCFIGTLGKLHLHEVPPERFYEITLIQAHFISFDLSSVYMQLPVCEAQRGWIKLNRKDAARVLAKMKSLKAEYPEEKFDIAQPAAL